VLAGTVSTEGCWLAGWLELYELELLDWRDGQT